MRRMIATHEPELVTIADEPLTIGERFRANVRRLMADQHLSQQGLADRLTAMGDPTSYYNIGQLLKSTSFPSTRWIELMARAFGVDEIELIS